MGISGFRPDQVKPQELPAAKPAAQERKNTVTQQPKGIKETAVDSVKNATVKAVKVSRTSFSNPQIVNQSAAPQQNNLKALLKEPIVNPKLVAVADLVSLENSTLEADKKLQKLVAGMGTREKMEFIADWQMENVSSLLSISKEQVAQDYSLAQFLYHQKPISKEDGAHLQKIMKGFSSDKEKIEFMKGWKCPFPQIIEMQVSERDKKVAQLAQQLGREESDPLVQAQVPKDKNPNANKKFTSFLTEKEALYFNAIQKLQNGEKLGAAEALLFHQAGVPT